jgi:hypothetical protein
MTTAITPQVPFSALEEQPASSQLKKPILWTVLSVAALVALLVTNPGGWILSAIGITAVALAFLSIIGANIANYNSKGKFEKQLMYFELTNLVRMLPFVTNYNEIPLQGLTLADGKPLPPGAILYVGALPNKNRPGNSIPPNVGAVVANNQDFEVRPLGLSNPLTAKDWEDRGAKYFFNKAQDHDPIPPLAMNAAADVLAPALLAGKGALSHCRGGVGRSATAAAAYMMRELRRDGQYLSIEEICSRIKAGRKESSIWYKLHALCDYDDYLKNTLGLPRPPRNPEVDRLADLLRKMEAVKEKTGIKALSK